MWEIQYCNQRRVQQDFLDKGWEPFAVTGSLLGEYMVWVRRRRADG